MVPDPFLSISLKSASSSSSVSSSCACVDVNVRTAKRNDSNVSSLPSTDVPSADAQSTELLKCDHRIAMANI